MKILTFKQWCAEVETTKTPAFIKFVNTVRLHWLGTIPFVEIRLTNGILECIKTKVQLIKSSAKRCRVEFDYTMCSYLANNES